MTVSEKKPRQNTGNHPDPLTEYPEARKRLEEALRASDDIAAPEVFCTRETARALLAGPPKPREPVAWRVKDFADGWILCHTEAQARREAEGCGNLVQPLYASPVPATEPILASRRRKAAPKPGEG